MNLGSLIGYLGLDTKDWDRGLDKAEGGLKGFAKKAGPIAAAAGAAVGAAVVAGVLEHMDIEAANDKLAAQLGLTAEESERVGGVAGKLYADAYGENLGDVNDAVAAVMSSIDGMSTASNADLEAMTAAALDFATAFEVDVTRSTQIAGQMITQGLAKDGTEAFDLLVSASQQVPAAIREDLLDATDEYGGFFADLGYTGPQAMALLVDASEKGMYGLDKLGDAVKEFGIRATDMSTASAVGYDLIGESQEEMTGRLLAGGDTARDAFQEIIAGVQGIEDPVAQSQAALALFGTPLEDLSVQEIPAFLSALQMSKGELENVEGAAGRMGDTLNDNAATKLESFKRKAQQVFVDFIGGTVLPKLEEFRAWLVDTFGPAFDTIKAALSGFFGGLSSDADTAGGSIGKIQTAVQSVKDFVGPAFESIKAIFDNFVIIVTAVWNTFGDTIVSYLTESWENIKLVIQGALDIIKGILDVFIGVFTGDWSRVWEGVKGIFSGAWNAIRGIFQQALNIIRTAASVFFGAIKSVFSAGWNAVKTATSAAWNSVTGAVKSGVSNVMSFITSLPGKIVSALSGLGSSLFNIGKNMIEGLLNGAKSLLKNIGRFFLDMVPGWIRGPFESALGISSPSKVFAGYGVNIGEGLIKGMAGMQGAVGSQMMKLADTQALGSLALASPSMSAMTAGRQASTSTMTEGSSSSTAGPLLHVDTVNLVEGTPRDVAQELAYLGRTRGV